MNDYPFGFKTAVESEVFEAGLNEEVIRRISLKKNEPPFMLAFCLKAYKKFLEMTPPNWANLSFEPNSGLQNSYPQSEPQFPGIFLQAQDTSAPLQR